MASNVLFVRELNCDSRRVPHLQRVLWCPDSLIEYRKSTPESLHKPLLMVAKYYPVIPVAHYQPCNPRRLRDGGDENLRTGLLLTIPGIYRPKFVYERGSSASPQGPPLPQGRVPEWPGDLNSYSGRPPRCKRSWLLYPALSSSPPMPGPRVSTPVFQPTSSQEL